MIRKNKATLLLTSVVILLPVAAGLLLWRRLPEQIPIHWGVDGTVDGWSGKGIAVFGLPLMLLAVHWLCVLVTAKDPGNRNQNRKVFGMVLWIVPVLSVFLCGIVYSAALGQNVSVEILTPLLVGILFLVIGNYMPKCRQNRTIGIKVKWTLENEANWNATHRMAGKLWAAGGAAFLLCGLLGGRAFLWGLALILPGMVIVPVVYSFLYARKCP